MKITREFAPADRYLYDWGLCSTGNGFAQVDTSQDASYFGTWANPFKLIIFQYCEGDTTMTECETEQEFCAEMRKIEGFDGYRFRGVDPGFNAPLLAKFEEIGLSNMLH